MEHLPVELEPSGPPAGETAAPAMELPHNLDAERALLGCMIMDHRLIDDVIAFFPPATVTQARELFTTDPRMTRRRARIAEAPEPLFFLKANETIFGAICDLHHRGYGTDLTTLAEHVQNHEQLEAVGQLTYLASLSDYVVALGQALDYARIVQEKWRLRALIRAAHEVVHEAAAGRRGSQEIIEEAERRILDISMAQNRQSFVPIAERLGEQMEEIEARYKGESVDSGLKTGFKRLDEMTAGLRPANMIILAARPSVGKTAFALNIATHVALHQGRPVGVFSLEMSYAELTRRLLCSEARVPGNRVMGVSGRPSRQQLEALYEARDRLREAPLHLDDTSTLTIAEMRARARRLAARTGGLGLLIIDYLQLMNSGASRVESRQQEVSEISRAIKGLARDLNVPIIALSQLSRQSEQRRGAADKLPRLSDLRESGAIEQDADVVIFIHRERTSKEGKEEVRRDKDGRMMPDLATINLGKQRNGATGSFEMMYHREITRFEDLLPQSDNVV